MTGIPSIASSDFALQIVLRTMQLLLMISVGCFMHRWTEWGVTEFSTQLLFYASVFNEQVAILKEEIYVGGISATKPCRNLLERRKTLLKPTEWCYSILLVCDKYNTTNWSDFPSMKINHMQSIIHKTPKSIATSRLHCIQMWKSKTVIQSVQDA